MKSVSSRQNPLVKRFRDAIREHAGEIALEGPKAVADAIAAGWRPVAIVTSGAPAPTAPPLSPVPGALRTDVAQITEVTPEVFQWITDTKSPQGVIGLFQRPAVTAEAILGRRDTIAVVLDGVQDPGNTGTIVRLAAAFGAAGVLLLPGSADAYGPKAIRASAGAILNVAVARITAEQLLAAEIPLVSTSMSGAKADPPSRNAVLIFGNEGSGVSPALMSRSTAIAIPMAPAVESLNVASSAAILLARSYALRV